MAVYKLKDICLKIGSGATPRGGKEAYCDEGISLIRSQNVIDFVFSYDGLAYINNQQAQSLNNVVVQPQDILLNITGDSVARACMVDVKALPARVNQHVMIIRVNEKIVLSSYILFYLQMMKPYLLQIAAGGATRNALTKNMIENLELEVPDVSVQKSVVSILDDIQAKIRENNEINKNLEQQMETIYKFWFVDFVPFGGTKPSNWQSTNIYSIVNIIYGAPFASKLFNTDGIGKPIIRIRDLKNQEFVTYTTEKHKKGHLIQPGDIVVGMDGEFRIYIWGNEEAWLNQRVCIFENKRPKGKAFVLFTLKPLLNVIEQTQVATTVIHIGKKDYDAFEIILPDTKTLNQFDEITAPMIEQIVNNSLENKRLKALRDALLPKLMSGELDVSNLEL